ncbi:MAG: hypothetical protein LBO72_02335 [Helicobacteraceae bacterium]|jgi:G:T/U-mismatch repair DNA glycosylase|nr:hypothetical protein [Helicobacteraceae bacterium]
MPFSGETALKNAHPYEPFNCAKAYKIVIGSIPPPRFCETSPKRLYKGDIDWYYGSRNNLFWNMASALAKEPLQEVKSRQLFCEKYSVGFVDIIRSCNRKKRAASDQYLCNISPIDISKILRENVGEKTRIFFTSVFAAKLFKRAIVGDITVDPQNRADFKPFNLGGKTFKALTLYSPSPRAANNKAICAGYENYKALLD